MIRLKLSRYFIFIGIISLLTVLFLIVQRSYENLIGPVKQVQNSSLNKPINPSLDIEVLDQIEKKETFPLDDFSPTILTPTSTSSSQSDVP